MTAYVYSLKKRKETHEYHLFEGVMNTANSCTAGSTSICKKMKLTDPGSWAFQCKDEEVARIEAAELGRTVCGICVSHLYTSYP